MAKLSIAVEVDYETISDLLCSAFDPGHESTAYWCTAKRKTAPKKCEYKDKVRPQGNWEYWLHEVPMNPGGSLLLTDSEDGDKQYTITPSVLQRGLECMAAKYPYHFSHIVSGDTDGTTADVFVQCCVFGEVRYS